MTISVAKAMGRATSIAADSARSRRAARVEAPARRCRMFSTMMIAASTSKPTAMASPPSVMVFRPTSSQCSSRPASAIDTGMVKVTTRAARQFPSRPRMTRTTKTAPNITARPTPPSADSTSADWS